MNKLTKAAIAGGVGIALLLGGAGTLATWNTSTNISGGTIVAGSLTIGTATSTGWSVSHTSGTNTTTTPLSLNTATGAFTVTTGSVAFTSSPGDKLIYTSTVPLTVTGTNLAAVLSLTSGAITAVPVTPTTAGSPLTTAQIAQQKANDALALALQSSVVFAPPSPTLIAVPSQPNTYNLATGLQNVTFTATMTFPNNAVTTAGVYSDNPTQGGSVNFAAMALTLTQTN